MQSIVLDGQWTVRPAPHACSGEAGLAEVRQQPDGWLAAQVPARSTWT